MTTASYFSKLCHIIVGIYQTRKVIALLPAALLPFIFPTRSQNILMCLPQIWVLFH